jgi:DNA mismatch repair protein MutS
MRQTALAAILHQIGSFVPAAEASLPLFDRIFTRVGAADDLSRGQSTFMVEMSEAATILRQATDRSLVILDEVGRGTSTQDGLAIAAAILEHIAKKVHCYTLFATHYHELVPFSAEFPSLKIAQVEVQEEEDAIRFTHRLIDGASGSSFGVDVAKIAGIPASIIARARQLMTESELWSEKETPKKRLPDTKAPSLPPLELAFEDVKVPPSHAHGVALQRILERLERTNILKTTPIQALTILDELKGYLEQKDQGSLFPEAPNLC